MLKKKIFNKDTVKFQFNLSVDHLSDFKNTSINKPGPEEEVTYAVCIYLRFVRGVIMNGRLISHLFSLMELFEYIEINNSVPHSHGKFRHYAKHYPLTISL